MGVEISLQTRALILALVLGVGIGLSYDLLRPLRRRLGRLAGALLDVLFCAIAGGFAFSYAMGADNGRLGIWELAAAAIGFLAYMYSLSDFMLRIFNAILEELCKTVRFAVKVIKKTAFSVKNLFQNMRQCFIIKKK